MEENPYRDPLNKEQEKKPACCRPVIDCSRNYMERENDKMYEWEFLNILKEATISTQSTAEIRYHNTFKSAVLLFTKVKKPVKVFSQSSFTSASL